MTHLAFNLYNWIVWNCQMKSLYMYMHGEEVFILIDYEI